MSIQSKRISVELKNIADAMGQLKKLGVIRSQKLIGDLGEWIALETFGGEVLSDSKNQAGYDIIIDGLKYQVKTHAKSASNKTRWSKIGKVLDFDILVVVNLTPTFTIHSVMSADKDFVIENMNNKNHFHWSNFQPRHNQMAKVLKNSNLVTIVENGT